MTTFLRIGAIALLVLGVVGVALAGKDYEGSGANPNEAMSAAIAAAKKKSKGGCLCKGWQPDMNEDCRKTNEGRYICRACGSNNKGSCKKGSEIERLGF